MIIVAVFRLFCSVITTVADAIWDVCDLTRPGEFCTTAVNNVSVWAVDRGIKERGVLILVVQQGSDIPAKMTRPVFMDRIN